MNILFKVFSRLTKAEREIYGQCLGQCQTCLMEGGCNLEKKLTR